jgi:OmpA-OmpF porin, OOP family
MNKGVVAVLAIAAAVFAGPVAAQDPGLYLGGSIGYNTYEESCRDRTVPCDNDDTAGRLFAGYQFTRWFALEAGYADFGKLTLSGNDPASGVPVRAEAHASGFDLIASISFNVVNNLYLSGKAGLYRIRVSSESDVNATGPNAVAGETSSGFVYGLGAEYVIGRRVGLRAEFLRYDNIGGQRSGLDNALVYSLGLLWRF